MVPDHKTKLAEELPRSSRNMVRGQIVSRLMDPIGARPRRMNMVLDHKTKLVGELLPSK